MHPKPRILIAADEPRIARALEAALSGRDYEVRAASDGARALDLFRRWTPDLVITDLSMSGMDAVALCRAVRTESSVPIIVLSVRGEEQAKIDSLDAGADDYVTKPFGMGELLARIRAALRRGRVPDAQQVFDVGDFLVDVEGHTVAVRGRPVRLTPKEFELLVHLARNWGRVLTHEALLAAVWGGSRAKQVEYLRVFVGQLRKKIEPDPASPCYIVTEPWIGYRFVPDP
jgi:two-component system, OmpR family, KDP operon response regulator KdpE